MDACDVLIVGGGPAGSTCARRLGSAGLDVIVMDKTAFPRDKVCAGWITPAVVAATALDPDEYARGRTFQAITGFRLGVIGAAKAADVDYGEPVSYGIRRCEFDDYLLRRAGVRLALGQAVTTLEQRGGNWIVNGAVTAPMLVGAGGHRCPVARAINPGAGRAQVVQAQEMEFPVSDAASIAVRPGWPELYFTADFSGYGWCLRKGAYLNVGFGRSHGHALAKDTNEFINHLQARKRVPADLPLSWRAHAYRLSSERRQQIVGDGVLLIGDSAGLAEPVSGEGIGPAIESGLLAAEAVIEADGSYGVDRLSEYERRLRRPFTAVRRRSWAARELGAMVGLPLARALIATPRFARFALDRCFLR